MPNYVLMDTKDDGFVGQILFEADGNGQAEEYGEAYFSSPDAHSNTTVSIEVYSLIMGRWSFKMREFQTRLGPLVARWTARRLQPQEATG